MGFSQEKEREQTLDLILAGGQALLCLIDDAIDFACTTPVGRAEDVCPCEGSGEGLEIGFNDRYLSDALKNAPADEIQLSLNTGSSPCIITAADGSDNFTYMILPVRLRAGQ